MTELLKAYNANDIQVFEKLMETVIDKEPSSYNEVIVMYAKLLIANEMFEQAYQVLIAETAIPYVEREYLEEFDKLLDLVAAEIKLKHEKTLSFSDESIYQILIEDEDEFKSVAVIDYLLNSNIRKHLEVIKQFLISKDANVVIKTLLIDLLVTQEVSETFLVTKFGEEISINPSAMKVSADSEVVEMAVNYFYGVLDDQPSFEEMAVELLLNYIIARYPFVDEINIELLCASIHSLVHIYNDEVLDFEEIGYTYGVEPHDVERSTMEVAKFMEYVYEKE